MNRFLLEGKTFKSFKWSKYELQIKRLKDRVKTVYWHDWNPADSKKIRAASSH